MKNLLKLSMLCMILFIAACKPSTTTQDSELEAKLKAVEAKLKVYTTQDSVVKANLKLFDKLDFEAYNKDAALLDALHTPDTHVIWADGTESRGMDQHNKDMNYMLSFLPDSRITSHPLQFGSGDWTAGLAIGEGTFSRPMVLANGKVIQPTGKSYKSYAITLARWKNGKIAEEYIFFDSGTMMKQIGVTK
jgi:ketosteroid isomerase-like protein